MTKIILILISQALKEAYFLVRMKLIISIHFQKCIRGANLPLNTPEVSDFLG